MTFVEQRPVCESVQLTHFCILQPPPIQYSPDKNHHRRRRRRRRPKIMIFVVVAFEAVVWLAAIAEPVVSAENLEIVELQV
jgi:hypothetical protein